MYSPGEDACEYLLTIPARYAYEFAYTHASMVKLESMLRDVEFGTAMYVLLPFRAIALPAELVTAAFNCTSAFGQTVVATGVTAIIGDSPTVTETVPCALHVAEASLATTE